MKLLPYPLLAVLIISGCSARIAHKHSVPSTFVAPFDRDTCDPNGDGEYEAVDKGCNNRATNVGL